MNKDLIVILNFFRLLERLKNELRHSWTSNGRQESVAEHSWRLSLMVIVCSSYMSENNFDLLKALQMAVIHDLGEIYAGDRHFLEINKSPRSRQERANREEKAVADLCAVLGKNGDSIRSLWEEFEEQKTVEAQVVNCLDKLEVCIQHSQADILTWTQEEINSLDSYFSTINPNSQILDSLKNAVYSECMKKTRTD